jgi:hypothetical protein
MKNKKFHLGFAPPRPVAPTQEIRPAQLSIGTLKATRAQLIKQIKKSEIPLLWQGPILDEIAQIPARYDLLRFDLYRSPISAGVNVTFTIREL